MDRFTDASWQADVLTAPEPVAVLFWAEWCVPSRAGLEAMEALAALRGGGLRFGAVNVDENPRTTERYRIQGLPTLLVFRGGELAERRVGLMSREDALRVLDRHA